MAWVIRTTVPFMLLAGLLGAALIESIPVDGITELPVNVVSLLGVALLGTFLPVPIAFDVIIASVLHSLGVPIAHVAVLLFTLGIFSIYPAMVVARSVSVKLVVKLFVSIVLLGMVTGFINR